MGRIGDWNGCPVGRWIGLLAAAAVLLLGGCASSGAGYGGYPHGPGADGYGRTYADVVQGTVDGLDRSYGRILLVVDDPRRHGARRIEVRYDRSTRLYLHGREAAVEGLERGDVVRIEVARSGRELWARTVEVLRDVRDGRGPLAGGYEDMRGSVAFVDARTRIIRLDAGGYARDMQLRYDGRTLVEYRGRRYRPEDLDRGDIVRIQAQRLGDGSWLAERIVVERSVRR